MKHKQNQEENTVDEIVWDFKNFTELHVIANGWLQEAMLNERNKRWRKVIDCYQKLFWAIDRANLPDEYEPPSGYNMLLYELYFHLGVAYQHVGEQRKAVSEFTKAIEAVSLPKNGCLAGCLMNSCLQTPIYARRAFAKATVGDLKGALKDAEKAVVLDSKNPAVYCIRALVWNMMNSITMGLKDLDTALKLNSSHLCSLVLKSSLTKPIAKRLNPESETYLNVDTFNHPCILEFYDKFLFALSVPHTITVINLEPDKPSKTHIESDPNLYKSPASKRPFSAPCTSVTNQREPFRCGTPTVAEHNKISFRRRLDYGEAVRKHVSRPKSATDFFSQLEKQREREANMRRALSRMSAQQVRTQPTTADTQSFVMRVRPQMAAARLTSPLTSVPSKVVSSPDGISTSIATVILDTSKKSPTTKKFEIKTPTNYTIPVFQALNIKDAPRMYYKPWNGDKLPVAEIPNRPKTPIFK
ncbi:hypothetical protein CHS0354_023542 [Potamilus streckersoni]|uniref:Uncharacterized protein n=1 Tax=Potamilus streckersoni TaxID=2493646 RepID=A0AAE0VRA1_9BIVA|nr:hypothetical protein CHS0354_023542 [Potamilus streckersoni]